jgi:hypothetical protein
VAGQIPATFFIALDTADPRLGRSPLLVFIDRFVNPQYNPHLRLELHPSFTGPGRQTASVVPVFMCNSCRSK